ncbi:MAG: hypothetical protein HY513_05945 [Candidatus Aenigmarchaeota archaeon]|nr:hypothetical protein [Candidatus Aenigmarchaeota archaeon]
MARGKKQRKITRSKQQKRKSVRNKERKVQTKTILAIIIIAAFAVSAFNITGLATGSRATAFITLSGQLQGSEKTIYNELSKNSAVTIVPVSKLPNSLEGYGLIAVSKQAGDTFTDEKRSLCKQIADYNKPLIFFSGQFSTVCRLTVGSSMAPAMPWEVITSDYYPTESYSGIITPYQASGSLPAIVASGDITMLVKRSNNDAYLALFLQNPRKVFFSLPDGEFAFTEQGKDLLDRTLSWVEGA